MIKYVCMHEYKKNFDWTSNLVGEDLYEGELEYVVVNNWCCALHLHPQDRE